MVHHGDTPSLQPLHRSNPHIGLEITPYGPLHCVVWHEDLIQGDTQCLSSTRNIDYAVDPIEVSLVFRQIEGDNSQTREVKLGITSLITRCDFAQSFYTFLSRAHLLFI